MLSNHDNSCACCSDLLQRHFDRRRFLHVAAGAGAVAMFPSLAFSASGNYDAMVLTCIDPRFPEPTINYMKSRDMVGKYSQFTFAGASIGVVAPAFKAWHKTFWDNLAASIQLHNIPKVIAIDHRDCGAAKIAYGPPKEGAMLWIDTAAIPKDAPNPDAAHRFLDFMMEPKVAAASSTLTGYANANVPATALLDKAITGNPWIYPPAEARARLYTITAANAEQTRERTRLWTAIKTGR